MAPGPSPDRHAPGAAAADRRLLAIAARSISHGLDAGRPWVPPAGTLDGELARPGAAFVTLELDAELRGCVGSVAPRRPLALDVAHNAYAAAFRDTRFAPLARLELDRLTISISVLGPLEPIAVQSDNALCAALRPGVDGLVLSADHRRAVFLPQVWDALPTPTTFVDALKRKGGFAPDEGLPALTAERFSIREIAAQAFADLAGIR